jgi:uncharacterized caspase-like protein
LEDVVVVKKENARTMQGVLSVVGPWSRSGRLARAMRALVLLVAMGLGTLPASAGARLALVVGNGNYLNAPGLPHAVRDARDMAARFREMGFEVHDGYDLSLGAFRQLLAGVSLRIGQEDAGEVVFYYAGHGFSLGSADRLVPVDAALADREDLPAETLALDAVLAPIVPGQGRSLMVFFDACRDSPFPAQGPGAGKPPGRSAMAPGVLVSFATAFGRPTRDGLGTHSPFARALLEALGTEPIPVADLLDRVRNSVMAETGGEQIPVAEGALVAPFSFEALGRDRHSGS